MSSAVSPGAESYARLLSRHQPAAVIGVPYETLTKPVRGPNAVPCVRIGRQVYFDPADIARWIDARRSAGGPPRGEG